MGGEMRLDGGKKKGGTTTGPGQIEQEKSVDWDRPPPPAFIICFLGMSFVLEQNCLMVYLEISHFSAIFFGQIFIFEGTLC